MTMPRSSTARWLLALSLSFILVACEKEPSDAPPTIRDIDLIPYPEPPKGEWFYRDTLTEPPTPLPKPAPSGPAYDALIEVTGLEVLEMEKKIDAIALPTEETLSQFRAALLHESPSVRYAACSVLGRGRCAGTAAALMDVLEDSEEAIALLALDGIFDQGELWTMPRIIKTFGQHVNSNHLSVRIHAAARLIEWGNYSGIPILIKVLKEKTPISDEINRDWDKRNRVAWEKDMALEALTALTSERFGYAPDASIDQQVKGAESFEEWWSSHRKELWQKTRPWADRHLVSWIERIIGALETFQLRNVDNSRFLLVHMGPPLVFHLSRAIEHGSFYIRFHGLEIFTAMAQDLSGETMNEVMRVSILSLRDPETAVREQAAVALGELGSEVALDSLKSLLKNDREVGVQKAAALALGKLGGASAIQSMRAALAKPGIPDALIVGLRAGLARAGEVDALNDFVDGLGDPSSSVRLETLDVLILLTQNDFGLSPPLEPPPTRAILSRVLEETSKSLGL